MEELKEIFICVSCQDSLEKCYNNIITFPLSLNVAVCLIRKNDYFQISFNGDSVSENGLNMDYERRKGERLTAFCYP